MKKLYLLREKQNSRKLARINCVGISGSMDKIGLSRYTRYTTNCSTELILNYINICPFFVNFMNINTKLYIPVVT